MSRRVVQMVGASVLTVGLVMAGGVAGWAATVPDSGPSAGGTRVVIDAPPSVLFDSVSAAGGTVLAISENGKVYAWGPNEAGQIGNGTTMYQETPVQAMTPDGVTFDQTSGGDSFSVALAKDGDVYAWGANSYGQLGDGTTTDRLIPQRVSAPAGVTFRQIAAGVNGHTLGIGSDGRTYAWGNNNFGQLGDGTLTNRTTPVPVQTPSGVQFTQLAAGLSFSLALGDDGKTYAWGFNNFGQLGDGTSVDRSAPVAVLAPAGVSFTKIAANGLTSFALGDDGNAYVWGSNSNSQLGNGTSSTRQVVPAALSGLPAGVRLTSIAAGYSFLLGIGTDGVTYAWGNNSEGQLGVGTFSGKGTPVAVQTPAGVSFTQVSGGNWISAGLSSAGTVYAWGSWLSRWSGPTPVPVPMPAPKVVVTDITFGGVAGTDLVDNGDGTISVTTPTHAAGPVDVVVSWTLGAAAKEPVTHTDGFRFTEAPTVTNPANTTVSVGGQGVFTVTTTGTPPPSVVWEVSTDDGKTWQPATVDPAAVPSVDGHTLTVTPSRADYDGYQYRAIAENRDGRVVSEAAILTVTSTAVVTTPPVTPNTTPGTGDLAQTGATPPATTGNLAQTGATLTPALTVVGALALLTGAALLVSRIVGNRRRRAI